MKALIVSALFLLSFSSYSTETNSTCPRPGSSETGEIELLLGSLNIPDANQCLYHQLNDFQVGTPMEQRADFCACREEYQSYSQSVGGLLDSSGTDRIKGLIQEQIELTTMRAFKSKLYEVQDTAIAIDTMIRNQELTDLDAYRVKECTANKIWETVSEIKNNNENKCPNLEKRISYFTGNGFMKSLSSMEDLREEMSRLTDAVNGNTKFSF